MKKEERSTSSEYEHLISQEIFEMGHHQMKQIMGSSICDNVSVG